MLAVPARFPYRLMRGVLVTAGVLYCSLLLELVAGYPLDVHESFLSELGAQDQTTSPYARALDLGAGVLLLLSASLLSSYCVARAGAVCGAGWSPGSPSESP